MKILWCGFFFTTALLYAADMPTCYAVHTSTKQGTGVVVSDNHERKFLVTHKHIIENNPTINTKGDDESSLALDTKNAMPVSEDSVAIPLIPSKAAHFTSARIASFEEFKAQAKPGTIVNTLGFVDGKPVTSEGVIAFYWSGKIYIKDDSGTNPGMSGAPVYNSNGVVIGIHKGRQVLEGVDYQVVEGICLGKSKIADAEETAKK